MMDEKQAFRLLITLLKHELLHERLPEDLKASIDEEVVKLLYLLAKRFDYAHTVGDILAREGLLSDIGKSKFKPFQYLSFYRYERSEYEISELRRVLNAARIPFMPLKGTVLRHRYPDPVMRVSCDIDILVPYDQAEMARDVLVKELSYRDDGRGDHDYQLYTPSELTVELHFQLYKTVDRVVYALGDVWEHAERLSPDGFEYAMSGDYFYAYMMTHMAKHFHEGGCGLKPFADLYVMKTYMPYDRPKAQAMLKEAGLLTFANEMEALCDYWFAEGDMPVMYDVTEEYLLEGGAYGGIQGCVVAREGAKSGMAYLLGRLFPPYREMITFYPKLSKCPILLPFYYIKRILKFLFSKEKESARSAVQDISQLDKKKAKRILQMYERLEIDSEVRE